MLHFLGMIITAVIAGVVVSRVNKAVDRWFEQAKEKS